MCRNSLRYTLAYTVYDLLYLLFWSETLSGHPGLPEFQLQYHLQVEQKHDHMIPCNLGWKHVPRLLDSGKKQESDMKVCACFLRNLGKLWTIILYSYNLMSNCTPCYTIWTNPPPKSMVYLSVLKPAVLCADSWMHVAESQCSSEAPHALLSEATEEEPAVYRCFFVIRIKYMYCEEPKTHINNVFLFFFFLLK